MTTAISVSGLVKTFGRTVALDELDLEIAAGEVHGYLGPNGAGKTTTIRVLLGLLRADRGQATLLGGDPWADAVSLHRRLAYVPGDVSLWPSLTGGEAIDLLGRLRGGLDKRRRAELLDSAGAVLCWGDDGDGQLGDGPALSDQNEPVEVSVDPSSSLHGRTVVDIAAHRQNTCAVDDEGAAHCWGDDQSGQLGNGGAATDEPAPVAVSAAGVLSGKQLDQVDVGGDFACALGSDEAVYCWGGNSAGQLGNDNLGADSPVPVAVSTDSPSSLHGAQVRQVNAGDAHACAVDTEGVAHCWGENGKGQVGNGAAPTDAARPYAVGGALASNGGPVLDIDATFEHTCAITFQAAAYCWGANDSGQLGNGTLTASDRPVRVRGLPEPPDPPTHLKATGGDRSLRVSWRAPAELGHGRPVGVRRGCAAGRNGPPQGRPHHGRRAPHRSGRDGHLVARPRRDRRRRVLPHDWRHQLQHRQPHQRPHLRGVRPNHDHRWHLHHQRAAAALCWPVAWMTLARRSRSASACRAGGTPTRGRDEIGNGRPVAEQHLVGDEQVGGVQDLRREAETLGEIQGAAALHAPS